MTVPTKAVFLSYASQDAEAARRICEALRLGGIEVWFDQNELRGGDVWDRQIRKHIHDCALFIPIISATTQGRTEGYFRREWKFAVDRTHDMSERVAFLVPVVIDNTMDEQADVPEAFRAVQWTRLPAGEAPPAFVARITQLLSPSEPQLSAQDRSSAGYAPAPRSLAPRASASRGSRLVSLLVAAVAIIGVGYYGLDRFVLARHSAASLPSESGLSAIPEQSIAVLPFTNMSDDKNNQYFSDGISEELMNLLTKIPDLRVTSRSSAFSFKDKRVAVPEIAKQLHVAHVLEGSVRKAGNHVRIAAQLIDARTDTELWSETFDRTLDDIFAAQDEISAAVVKHLKLILLEAVPHARRVNGEAYTAFLQARQAGRLHTAEGYAKSVGLYQKALAIDPAYADAWTGLAYDYRRQANNGMRPLDEGYRLAGEALRNALAIDPKSSRAYAELGRIELDHEIDFPAAAQHLSHALSLDPNNPDIIGYAAILADSMGRLEQAIAINKSAIARDPLNPTLRNALGIEYRYLGQFDNAIAQSRTALSLSPHSVSFHYRIGEALLLQGKPEQALAEIKLEPSEPWRMAGIAMALHSLHQKPAADAALAALIERDSKGGKYNIAFVLAWRGEADRAFEYLEKAVEVKDTALPSLAVDSMFAKLPKDPRWSPFLHRLGMAPEQLAAIKFEIPLPK